MITVPTSQVQNTDRSRWSSIRHGGPRANVRLRAHRRHRSSRLKADSCTRGGPIMRGNVIDQRAQWHLLPSRTSFAARKSP